MLIDTHCHLDLGVFDGDRDRVLRSARAATVGRIVVPAIEAVGWPYLIALCQTQEGLYPALGLHPLYLDRHQPQDLQRLESLIRDIGPVAVGEIGLDYLATGLDRQRQQQLFEAQLELAAVNDLPVLIHARKSHDQIIVSLRRLQVKGGIVHAFNGSIQQAYQYLDLGFKLGFGGMLTFDRSTRLRALATKLPLGALVLETDAPDMTVAAHQGERNSPAYLPDILRALAELRCLDRAYVAEQTSRNALAVLDLAAWDQRRRHPCH